MPFVFHPRSAFACGAAFASVLVASPALAEPISCPWFMGAYTVYTRIENGLVEGPLGKVEIVGRTPPDGGSLCTYHVKTAMDRDVGPFTDWLTDFQVDYGPRTTPPGGFKAYVDGRLMFFSTLQGDLSFTDGVPCPWKASETCRRSIWLTWDKARGG